MPLFETTLSLPASREQLFDFLIRPNNLLQLAPPDIELQFINPPEILQLGSRLKFQVSTLGTTQQIEHEITQFAHPNSFTEIQIDGPLTTYRHEHLLETDPDGQLRIIDRIEFEPPSGLAGFVINEKWIRNSLETGFEHRHRKLKEIVETFA